MAEPGRFSAILSPSAEEKHALRRKIKRSLSVLKPEDFRAAGIKAAAFFKTFHIWQESKTILLFISTKNEIDTSPLLEAACEEGKTVFVPRVESAAAGMSFYRIESLKGPWNAGAFGIKEPLPCENNSLKKTDFPALIFTPGLAFDGQGKRLGRGAAFYDRFFAALEEEKLAYYSAGLCLKIQVLPSVPAEKWDRRVNYLGSF